MLVATQTYLVLSSPEYQENDPLVFRHVVATLGIKMEDTKDCGFRNCIHADNRNPTLFRWPEIVKNRPNNCTSIPRKWDQLYEFMAM